MNAKNPTTPEVLTVSELTQAIKVQLESCFSHILMKGEISNLKLQSSGHMYFSLKDEHAQIACVMFRQDLLKVRVPLKVGDQVVVKAEMNVYPAKGNYQLIVKEISLVGLGELLLKLELLKQKLYQLGYFAPEKKKPLPHFPKRIGIVTSPTGAVIRDIINVLSRRLKGFHLILNPVRVQGDGAAAEIAQAIDQFNQSKLVDVIIVCRGGGSVEDLMPFNDERVAEAIFRSVIPIISAVGHETDTSISDFVADIRAPTPSAAAEIVSYETAELLGQLTKCRRQMQQHLIKNVSKSRSDLTRILRQPLFTSSLALLAPSMQRLDGYKEYLDQNMHHLLQKARQDFQRIKRSIELLKPERRIQENALHLKQIDKAIHTTMQRIIVLSKRDLEQLIAHLSSLNPKSVLQKGYSILFHQKDGHVITSIKAVKAGDPVRALLSDGEVTAQIT
ncbi:MAG: xseA [Chlamydiia bacterium]|nr:xseA [Chlamydiia bacterium]